MCHRMSCKGFDISLMSPPLAGTAEGGGTWRHILHNKQSITYDDSYVFSLDHLNS